MRNLLIDTDTASDDAVAIMMALAEPMYGAGARNVPCSASKYKTGEHSGRPTGMDF